MSALVTDGSLVAIADWHAEDGRFYVGRDDLLLSSDRITHWMPLPEPPTLQQPPAVVVEANAFDFERSK